MRASIVKYTRAFYEIGKRDCRVGKPRKPPSILTLNERIAWCAGWDTANTQEEVVIPDGVGGNDCFFGTDRRGR